MTVNIPFSKVTTGQEEIDAVTRVMKSGWLATGPETEAFEKEFAEYITPGDPQLDVWYQPYYCIFTNSCTSALKMAYKYAKEKGFNYFSCPDNTFCATYAAGEEMGLKRLPFGISAMPPYVITRVWYGGVKEEYSNPFNWFIIEDSAHRIEPNDPLVGKIRCYSFYATKNMTTGSGGMLVTNDKEIYERCRLFWKDGLSTSTADRLNGNPFYRVEVASGGYDGNDIAAAIGRVQLKKLTEFTKRRNEIRDGYNAAFGQTWTGNHLYPYFVSSEQEVKELIEYLKENGIGCGYHYPETGWLGVSLPIYPLLTDEEQEFIVKKIKEWDETIRNNIHN